MAGPDDLEDDVLDPLEEDDILDPVEEDDELLGEDPPGDDLGEDPIDPPARTRSRGETRLQKLANERNELRERLARLEGERDASNRHSPQPTRDPRAEYEREQALLTTMTADEKIAYYDNKNRQEFGRALQEVQASGQDKLDRIEFRDLCRDNKAYKSVAEQVEAKVKELRSRGQPVPEREVIAKFLIGEAFVSGGLKKAQAAQAKADTQARRQRGKPPAGGGDVIQEDRRGRGPQTAKERLQAAEAKGLRW